jgi:putative membrane protein
VGVEGDRAPQSRASDHLANERTLLAWIRTSVSIIVFGFVVSKFGITLRRVLALSSTPSASVGTGASEYLGIAFIAIGVLFALGAWIHYARTRAAIERGNFRPVSLAGTLLVVVVAVFGIALIGYLVLTAASF